MTWTWNDPQGREVSVRMSSRDEAEAWLGQNWEDLLDEGVEEVCLCEDDVRVMGPMLLAPEE